MPKGKKKGARKGGGSQPPSDEEYDTADNWSTASVLSEDTSIPEEEVGENGEVDDTSAIENFEDKLKDCIDGLSQKSAQGRKNCLDGLIRALSKKYIYDFLIERKMTVADSVSRCLKKGKGDEQALAARCLSLLCIQLGLEAGEECTEFQPSLLIIMTDNSAALKARSECATALSICNFIASSDIEVVNSAMNALENVFKCSYRKGDKSIPSHSPEVCRFHSSALAGWNLLLSIAPAYLVTKLIVNHLPKLPDLLLSSDVDLRITAGETIALMYELAREEDEYYEGPDMDGLCEILKKLATDSQKHRAKKDRRQQRSSFREILRAVEEGEAPEVTIKFGREALYLDSWVKKKQYDCLCMAIPSGIYQHLQENILVREVFGLGAPLEVGSKPEHKPTKWERAHVNAAMFKARTKARAKHRDKRSVMVNGGD